MYTKTETAFDNSYATHPFDSDDADSILISSDGMVFFVHKNILSLVSPVLSNMFSFDEHTQLDLSDGCPPIVRLTEDSTTLDTFLRIIYPVESPELGLDEMKHLLEVSQKYQSTTATIHLSLLLLHVFVDVDPYTVFTIACLSDLETVARAAAQRVARCVSLPPDRSLYSPEMKDISAGSYFRLLWHIARHRAGISIDEDYWGKFSFIRRNPGDGIPLAEDTHTACTTNKQISEWKDFGVFSCSPPDIILRSSDGVEFPVHKFILSIMSSFFAESATVTKSSSSDDSPFLEVPEDSHLLHLLLCSCYSIPLQTESSSLDMSQFIPFVLAAWKYGMEGSIARVRLLFQDIFKTNPVRGYFVAISLGWTDEAGTTASYVATGTADVERTYVSEMEVVNAEAYFNLLRYRTSVQVAIAGSLTRYRSRRNTSPPLEERYYPTDCRRVERTPLAALVKKNIKLILEQEMNKKVGR